MVSAQTTVEILGDGGTTTNSYLPAYTLYNNTLSEQIYTAEEVGMAGSILSIAFYNGGSEKTPNIKLYMINTDQNEFTSTTDWLTVGTEDLVYEGNVTFSAGDWTVIQLDSPFEYDGTSNLGVIVDEYMSWSNGLACRVFTSTSNCAMYVYSDGTDYNAIGASYTANSRLSVKNQIVLEILPSGGSVCARPNHAVISGITSEEATLSWTAGDEQTEWEVYCDTGAVDYDQISWISVNDTFYTFSGLNPNTQYTAYVRTVCGSEVSGVRTKSFNTSMIAAQMPFFCDFEDTDVNSFWAIRNGNQTNKWYIGPAVNYTTDGENALYVSNDNGVTNAYTNSTASAVWAFFDLEFSDATEFDFSFDYRVNGEGTSTLYDYMKVFVGAPSDVQDGSYSTPANATEVGVFNLHDSWQTANLLLPGSFANSTQRVYFLWRNDGSAGTNPPAAVDNISLRALTCPRPESISVSDVTTTTADIHITPAGDNSSEYAIYLSGAMTGYYTSTDTVYTLVDLNPSSFYTVQVRSLCSDDSSNLSNAVTFCTACDAITITEDNSWFEDFESYSGNDFVCWTTPVTYTASNGIFPMVYCGYGQSCHSGVNSCEFKGTTNLLVLPEFTNDISELRLSFWATATTVTSGTVEVGYVTDALDATTFVSLANAGTPGPRGGSSAGNGNPMGPFDFEGVSEYDARIALRYTNASSPTASWNLDDFTVQLSPDCPSPVKTSVQASNIGSHNATITWVDNDENHVAWTVYYKEAAANDEDSWMTVPATETEVNLTELDPETEYQVYVVTDCGYAENNPDATLTISFTTTPTCSSPTNLTVS